MIAVVPATGARATAAAAGMQRASAVTPVWRRARQSLSAVLAVRSPAASESAISL